MITDNQSLHLDVATAFKLMKQLRADCHLLVSCHCMDYSLLLGVHKTNLPRDDSDGARDFVSFNQSEGTAIISVPESEDSAIYSVGSDGRPDSDVYYLGHFNKNMSISVLAIIKSA